MAEKEIWKTYPKYPWIEASNLGNIRTKDHWTTDKNGNKRLYKGHVLKQQHDRHGYMQVISSMNGKKFFLSVHRVIATCFVPNPNNLPEVNHKDNNPTNNRWDNLEWCTRQYNIDYKKNFGTSAAELFGKPVFAVDLNTGKVLRFETQSEAARKLNVNIGNLNSVVKGKKNSAGGYWFTEDESEITEERIQKIKENMRFPDGVIAVNQETSEIFWFESQHEAGRQLGVFQQHINDIIKGRRNTTHGYYFCRADSTAVEKTRAKFGDKIADKVEKLLQEHQ